jgi:hypothetical protein
MDAVFAVSVLMIVRLVVPLVLMLAVGSLVQRRLAGKIW